MADCAEFLDRYSEYRDGLLSPVLSERFAAHLDSCASCARYHRVVVSGVEAFAGLPELSPSTDFALRLQDRLREEEWMARRATSGAPLGVTVAVAAALGLAAWLPTLGRDPEVAELPAVLAKGPPPVREPAVSVDLADFELPSYVPIHGGVWQPAFVAGSSGGSLAAYALPLAPAPAR